MILAESRGEVDPASMRAWLVERDARLDLDYDIAWANQFLVGHLVEAFPDALFIALVREPRSWMGSVVGHLLSREIPPEVRGFLDWWFRPDRYPMEEGDEELGARGLYSAAAFLNAWKRHVDVCHATVPAHRLLVLRTGELSGAPERLARFLGIPPESLDTSSAHLNQSTWRGELETLVDPERLREAADAICGEHVAALFPEL